MYHVMGKSWGSLGVSNHRDVEMVRKIPVTSRRKVRLNWEIGDVRDKTGEVGDVAEKSTGASRVCRVQLLLSHTSREVDITEFGLKPTGKET